MTSTETYPEVLQELLKDLWADPSNQRVRAIAADCAEDCNQPIFAECLRWMAANDKYPDSDFTREPKSGEWTWWWSYEIKNRDGGSDVHPKHSVLPNPPFLDDPAEAWEESAQEAEEAFYKAWNQSRKQGWSPP